MAVSIISESISGISGVLGGLLGRHSHASKHIAGLLSEAQNAAASSDWQGVADISNQIMAVEGASQAMMSGARNLAHAAHTAVQTFATLKDTALPPAQVAMTTVAQQQLVMSEIAALVSQLQNENHGIFTHLWHAHNLASHGVV